MITSKQNLSNRDVKRILSENIDLVLDYYDIDYYYGGNRITSNCPVHNGDNLSAFHITIDFGEYHGLWHCFTQGCQEHYGNDVIGLIAGIMHNKNGIKPKFSRVMMECRTIIKSITNDIKKTPKYIQSIETYKPPELIKKRELLDSLQIPAQYYIDRGFTKDVLVEFSVGLCVDHTKNMYNRVVFPIFDNNTDYIVGCVGRTIVEHPTKWLNSRGLQKSNLIYNYWNLIKDKHKSLILVEGQGDVLRLYEAGIKNVGGIFGCNLSNNQVELIRRLGVTDLFFLTDNDDAGLHGRDKALKKYGHLFKFRDIKYPSKDVGELSIDEVHKYILPYIRN